MFAATHNQHTLNFPEGSGRLTNISTKSGLFYCRLSEFQITFLHKQNSHYMKEKVEIWGS